MPTTTSPIATTTTDPSNLHSIFFPTDEIRAIHNTSALKSEIGDACGLVVLGGGELPPEPLGHPTDTTHAWRRIPVVFADEVLDAVPTEYVTVAVERVAEATPLPECEHPNSAAYVFGPENGSLDETILERCTHVVSIPGHVCSNLAAAVNVVLYDRVLGVDSATRGRFGAHLCDRTGVGKIRGDEDSVRC